MKYIVFAILILAGYFLSKYMRKNKVEKPSESSNIIIGYGVKPTKNEIEQERKTNEEIIRLLESNIISSGLFKKERVPALIGKIREVTTEFGRVSTKLAFEKDEVLTLEEKKSLGLNTRSKYSKFLIECFEPSRMNEIDPRVALENMHLSAFHKISNKKELQKLKNLGFVKKVKIMPAGDKDDCQEIKSCKKVYSINEVPELPFPECNAAYCRCCYEAIVSK